MTLEQYVNELAGIQAEQARLKEVEGYLKGLLHKMLPDTGNYKVGDLTVSVQTNRKFDPDKARELLPAEMLPIVEITTTTIDGKKVQALFPDVFEQAQKQYEHKLLLK